MAEIRWPPVLRVGHQCREIFLQRCVVEAQELLRVVEALAHRIGLGGMLVQEFDLQLVRPPVLVCGGGRRGAVVERAFGFGCHIFFLRSVELNSSLFGDCVFRFASVNQLVSYC